MQAITNLLINGVSPVTVGGTGITVKYFPKAPGASIGVASSSNGYLYAPDSLKLNGQQFQVKAAGNFTVGSGAASSPIVTVALYPVTFAGNVPSGTATISATPVVSQSLAAASDLVGYYPWAIRADLMGDNNSGILQLITGNAAIDGINTNNNPTASATVLSGVNFNSPVPFAFVVGVTFSVSDPGALANMYQFYMEA